tara:strand:- start:1607 stop:2536 length:930 start_codon:yes stop_codon:yes gene_type:complete
MIAKNSYLTVVGSIAYDDVITSEGAKDNLFGGSATYFSISASNFSNVSIVGTVGKDFRESDINLLKSKNIDTSNIKKNNSGNTFRWKGDYKSNPEEPETIYTSLGVFEEFSPKLNETQLQSSHAFLANISPDIQLELAQSLENKNVLVGLDTMNHWILEKKETLVEVIKKINVIFINKTEASLISENSDIDIAAKYLLEYGPDLCIIKDGKIGSYMYTKDEEMFFCPTYNIDRLVDPTGAGDSFAGGFFGYLSNITNPKKEDFQEAMIYGSTIASFTIEGFGIENLLKVEKEKINFRFKKIKSKVNLEQ